MSTPKNLSYWEEPRDAIASAYKNDDIAYSVTGFHAAIDILRISGITLEEARRLTILDYGCGTARVTRALAYLFKHIYGFDPVSSCIEAAQHEGRNLKQNNVTYSTELPSLSHTFDVVCAVNVLEHLNKDDQEHVLKNVIEQCQEDGRLILWYSTIDNHDMVKTYLDSTLEDNFRGINVRCFNMRNIP